MGLFLNRGKTIFDIFELVLKCGFRSNLAEMEEQFYDLSSFAVDDPAMEGMSLIDTIKKVKPNILIGKL